MKRKHFWFLAVALLLAVVCILSWFRVDGSELPSIENLSEHYIATISKTAASHNNFQSQEYILTDEQILALKEVLLNSRFTRRLSHSYSYKGLHDTYSIVLELDNEMGKQVDFIQIFFVEDLYFSVVAPYSGERMTLKIRNPQLDEMLDQIILENNDSQ